MSWFEVEEEVVDGEFGVDVLVYEFGSVEGESEVVEIG